MSHRSEAGQSERSYSRGLILTFHKTQPSFSFGASNYSPTRLERLLRLLQHRGFSFVSVKDAITNGKPTDLAVTFDDGYAHLAGVLPKLMDTYGIKPTIFMPTAYIGQNNGWDYSSVFQNAPHLDEATIRDLAKTGVEFGTHGHQHIDLSRCSSADLAEELRQSKSLLESILGTPVSSISYPFGRVNEAIVEQARAAGYMFGFTMKFPTAADRSLAIGRLPIYGYDTPFSVRQKVERGVCYKVERIKSGITSRLSGGTSLWHRLSGRNQ